MSEPCRLCDRHEPLQQSHVIPAFVYSWLKETSGTGFLRFGSAPNKRVQDGHKRPWLCRGCEGRLAEWERKFSENIFNPINSGAAPRIAYDEWMLKFTTSLSWRALMLMRDENLLDHFAPDQIKAADEALRTWRAFLLDQIDNPRQFEQHLLPLGTIEDSRAKGLPANFNRWIHRTVQIDPVRNPDSAFVFVKFGRFLLFGFIEMADPREWEGTKLRVRRGILGKDNYAVPAQLRDYMIEQAGAFAKIQQGLSQKQWARIDETMWADVQKVADSESFKAMKADVDEFGTEAFRIHRQQKE